MTSATRRELLRVLDDLSARMPDVRLGQLVVNLAYAAKGPTQEAVWDVEDDDLLRAAREQLHRHDQAPSVA